MRILFWNVNGKDLTDHVCEIVQAHTADVIVLNECKVSIDETLRQLKSRVASSFLLPSSMSTDRFHCFIRNPVVDMTEIHLGFRASFRQLKPRSEGVVLGLVHDYTCCGMRLTKRSVPTPFGKLVRS